MRYNKLNNKIIIYNYKYKILQKQLLVVAGPCTSSITNSQAGNIASGENSDESNSIKTEFVDDEQAVNRPENGCVVNDVKPSESPPFEVTGVPSLVLPHDGQAIFEPDDEDVEKVRYILFLEL